VLSEVVLQLGVDPSIQFADGRLLGIGGGLQAQVAVQDIGGHQFVPQPKGHHRVDQQRAAGQQGRGHDDAQDQGEEQLPMACGAPQDVVQDDHVALRFLLPEARFSEACLCRVVGRHSIAEMGGFVTDQMSVLAGDFTMAFDSASTTL